MRIVGIVLVVLLAGFVAADVPTDGVAFCQVFGLQNTHFRTFDGLRYDYVGEGEYWLLKTDDFKVQIREAVSAFPIVDRTDQWGIVAQLSSSSPVVNFLYDGGSGLNVRVGDCELSLSEISLSGGVTVKKTDENAYLLTGPNGGLSVSLNVMGTPGNEHYKVDVVLTITQELVTALGTGVTRGLCGTFNGVGSDDLCVDDTTCYTTSQSDVNSFSSSLRVAEGDTIFYYGGGKSWTTYNSNPTFAGTLFTPSDGDWSTHFVGDNQQQFHSWCSAQTGADYVQYVECMNDLMANQQVVSNDKNEYCETEFAGDQTAIDECKASATIDSSVLVAGSPSFAVAQTQFTELAPSTESTCAAAVTPTNMVKIGTRSFAMLDNTESTAAAPGGQSGLLMIPEGWEVASDSTLTKQAIALGTWGTDCVIMIDGIGVNPQTGNVCAEGSIAYQGTTGSCAAPGQPNQRIIISHQENTGASAIGYCQSSGDPHFTSFDQKRFHFQGKGEFLLAGTKDNALNVYARQEPWNAGRATVNTAVAVHYRGDYLELYAPVAGQTSPWDVPHAKTAAGEYTDFSSPLTGSSVGLNSLSLTKSGSSYTIQATDGGTTKVVARIMSSYMNLGLSVDEQYFTQTEGLCGMFDADPTNDFTKRDGDVYKTTDGTFHEKFGMSWQITCDSSPFSYSPGTDCTTINDGAGYSYDTVPEFATHDAKVAAETKCREQGLTGMDLIDCLFDISVMTNLGATDVAANTKVDSSVRTENQQEVVSPTATITNYFDTDNYYRYAMIDNAAFGGGHGCQSRSFELPAGWEVSEFNSRTQSVVVGRDDWPTECVVFKSGLSLRTDTLQAAGSFCGEADIVKVNGAYGVTSCDKRVLIEKRLEEPHDYEPPHGSAVCSSTGDPHFRTFDGSSFNFYGVGEFTLVEAIDHSLAVQVRHKRTGGASANTAIVVVAGNPDESTPVRFAVYSQPFSMKLDGVVVDEIYGTKYVDTPIGTMELADDENTIYVSVNGLTVTISVSWYLNLRVSVSEPQEFNTLGLCGTFDYQSSNDLTEKDGTVHETRSQSDIHEFGSSWRITSVSDSFFDYDTGMGPNSYNDYSFEPNYYASFTSADKEAIARQDCESKSFGSDSRTVENCMYDLSVNDETVWADMATSLDGAFVAKEQAIGTSVCVASRAVPTAETMVEMNGRHFALLDGTSPYSFNVGGQDRFMRIPVGWEVASADESLKRAIMELRWGTECVVFADGSSVNTKTGEDCGEDALAITGSESTKCVGPTMSNRRVLITESDTLGQAASFCQGYGAGHWVTFSGLPVDFEAVGEFLLYEADLLAIQGRMEKWGLSTGLTAVEIKSGSNEANRMTFGVYGTKSDQEPVFRVGELNEQGNLTDSEVFFIELDLRHSFGGATVMKTFSSANHAKYRLDLSDGTVVFVTTFDTRFINVNIQLPYTVYSGKGSGICGPYTGDLIVKGKDGTQCDLDDVTCYRTQLATWRIEEYESMFTYSLLKGESYSLFQDLSFVGTYGWDLGINEDDLRKRLMDSCEPLTMQYENSCFQDVVLTRDSTPASQLGISKMSQLAQNGWATSVVRSVLCTDAQEKAITNTFKYLQYEYALLDDTAPTSTTPNGQTEFLRVPAGWALAEWTNTNRNAVKQLPNAWGSTAVVFGNGFAMSTSDFDLQERNGLIKRAGSCVNPEKAGRRVLIRRLDPIQICAEDCSLRGQCINGLCKCDEGWTGPDCADPVCINDCSSHGSCIVLNEVRETKSTTGPIVPSMTEISLSPFADSLSFTVQVMWDQVTDPNAKNQANSFVITAPEDKYGFFSEYRLVAWDSTSATFQIVLNTDGMGSDETMAIRITNPASNGEVGEFSVEAVSCIECSCAAGWEGADCNTSSEDSSLSGWAIAGIVFACLLCVVVLASVVVVVIILAIIGGLGIAQGSVGVGAVGLSGTGVVVRKRMDASRVAKRTAKGTVEGLNLTQDTDL